MKAVSIALVACVMGCAFAQPATAGKPANFRETVLWSFGQGKDGAYPEAALIELNGILYGTTIAGGQYDDGQGDGGTVFALDPNTGAEKVVHSFCGQVYCPDGSSPVAGLIKVRGKLFGTTTGGGKFNTGAVFVLNPSTGRERVLYSFCTQEYHQSCEDGASPYAGLIDVNGTLYGTACCGGTNEGGTAFALDRRTGVYNVLYQFCQKTYCTDGSGPGVGGLIDVGGTLYGTTDQGGAFRWGTVFSIDPISGSENVLYSFCGLGSNCSDGSQPQGLVSLGSMLYGITASGGSHRYPCYSSGTGCGTVFSFNLQTGKQKVLHSFGGIANVRDGNFPFGGLVSDGTALYGTTAYGGANGYGTVYSIDKKTGAEKVLYSFCSQTNCTDGSVPYAGLIDVNGTLYGTTTQGGTGNCTGLSPGCGTVFSIETCTARGARACAGHIGEPPAESGTAPASRVRDRLSYSARARAR